MKKKTKGSAVEESVREIVTVPKVLKRGMISQAKSIGPDEGQPAHNSCSPFAWFALRTPFLCTL